MLVYAGRMYINHSKLVQSIEAHILGEMFEQYKKYNTQSHAEVTIYIAVLLLLSPYQSEYFIQ